MDVFIVNDIRGLVTPHYATPPQSRHYGAKERPSGPLSDLVQIDGSIG